MVQSKLTDAAVTLETGRLDTFVYVKTKARSVDYRPVSDTSTYSDRASTCSGVLFDCCLAPVVDLSPGL